MDTSWSKILRVSICLTILIELNHAQLYSSIPLHVYTVPSSYSWSAAIRNPETPLGRKLIYNSYPSDILVESNAIYYPPNSNALPRNYILQNPISGKSPVIFRPNHNFRHQAVPIRTEYARIRDNLRSRSDLGSKTLRSSSGYVLDNAIGSNLGQKSTKRDPFWTSRIVPAKPFSFTVYDATVKKSDDNELKSKGFEAKKSTTVNAKVEAEPGPASTVAATVVTTSVEDPPAQMTSLSETVGFVGQKPEQFYKKEKNGRVIFGFHNEEQTRMEARDADSKVYGAYAYFDPTGNPVRMQYWDEGKGFHTAGNRLPQNVANLPQVVTDTPEVQAARSLHFKIYEQTLAHLIKMQNVRPPADSENYGESIDEAVSNKPSAPAIASTEDDDDEVIIDSQTLPDEFHSLPIDTTDKVDSNNAKESDFFVPLSEKQSKESSQTFGSTRVGLSPTSNLVGSTNGPDSVVIENLEFKSVSKRSIENNAKARNGRKTGEKDQKSLYFGETGNVPIVTFAAPQLPLLPQFSIISASRVFPSEFKASLPELDHLVPGKFAPSIKIGSLKSYTGQFPVNQPEESEQEVKLIKSPFSPVAHKFEQFVSSKPSSASGMDTPFWSQGYGKYSDDYTNVYTQHFGESQTFSGSPDPYRHWFTSPSAPDTSLKFEQRPPPHQKPQTSPANEFHSFLPIKFGIPDFPPSSEFHLKPDSHQKGPDFYRPSTIPTSFYNTAPFPPFLYPHSSQSFIHHDFPSDHHKFHGSGLLQYFPKSPASLTYDSPNPDFGAHQFNFPSGSQLPIVRPFIGHDYTLLDKNIPYDNSYQLFSGNYTPASVNIPEVSQLSGSKHKLPNIGEYLNKGPHSETKPPTATKIDQTHETSSGGSSISDLLSAPKPEITNSYEVNAGHLVPPTPELNPFNTESAPTDKNELQGLKIIVTDAPLTETNNKPSSESHNKYSEIVNHYVDPPGSQGFETSTGIPVSNESNESNNSAESIESGENAGTSHEESSQSESESDETSLSNEANKADSSLVVDGRLTVEETTSVIESITEAFTEESTATTDRTGIEAENSKDGDNGTSSIKTKETESGRPIEENLLQTEFDSLKERPETQTKSPDELEENTNLPRRNTFSEDSVSMIAHQRNAIPVAAVHDAQISPRQ